MKNFFNKASQAVRSFSQEEEGAQVVEYALIIAVVSIALVVALSELTKSDGSFTTFIDRVKTCLTPAAGKSCV